MFVRQSKYRHIFGKALKREQCYDALRISRSSWDSKFCAVNPKFVAVITESGGGGSFAVISLPKVGRLDINAPQVVGHKGAVYDIAWCPHNDNVIASCSEDCSVKVWNIPEGGLTEPMTEAAVDLAGHQRRATSIVWHPSAINVLTSTGSDNRILIWNVLTGQAMIEVMMPDQVYSLSFTEDGSQFACTCKDKKLRVIDSHSGEVVMTTAAHEGSKPQQCVFLKENKVFTTGFSKMSERQYALWDVNKGKLEKLCMEEMDSSNGVMFIFYDPDTSVVYLAGKGDSQIRYFEVTKESPFVHFLSTYSTSNPQKGLGFMPKRGLNIMQNEIARFYKLHNNGLCEVTPFTVPRKSELFQEDLYPDTASDQPAITADEFFNGKNAMPILQALNGNVTATKKEVLSVVRKSNVLEKVPAKAPQNNSTNGAEEPVVAAAALPPKSDFRANAVDVSNLKQEIEELKKIVSKQDKRIETLEERVSNLEQANNTDEEEGEVA